MILGKWGQLGLFGRSASNDIDTLNYMVEVAGHIKSNSSSYRVIESNETVRLYQYSDNVLRVPVINDASGESVDASSFSRAEYIIASAKGDVRVRLSLDEGVVIKEDAFIIFIDDSKLDKSFKGNFNHQFVVWNESGDKLPPLFMSRIMIERVIL
ncbi:MAG: hypothetical protein CMP19_10425 [Rickettsiales bacterium]|nr:hypothetical protein [Rickettsiales bacterium]